MIKNLTTLFEKWGSEVNPKIAVSDEESSLSYDELFNSVALISNIIKNYNFKQKSLKKSLKNLISENYWGGGSSSPCSLQLLRP